jgi:hypothetical protein
MKTGFSTRVKVLQEVGDFVATLRNEDGMEVEGGDCARSTRSSLYWFRALYLSIYLNVRKVRPDCLGLAFTEV